MIDIEETAQKQITVTMLHCLRCGYDWLPRKTTLPQHCPDCNSPYWSKPRIKNKRVNGKLVFPETPCCRANQKEDNEK